MRIAIRNEWSFKKVGEGEKEESLFGRSIDGVRTEIKSESNHQVKKKKKRKKECCSIKLLRRLLGSRSHSSSPRRSHEVRCASMLCCFDCCLAIQLRTKRRLASELRRRMRFNPRKLPLMAKSDSSSVIFKFILTESYSVSLLLISQTLLPCRPCP